MLSACKLASFRYISSIFSVVNDNCELYLCFRCARLPRPTLHSLRVHPCSCVCFGILIHKLFHNWFQLIILDPCERDSGVRLLRVRTQSCRFKHHKVPAGWLSAFKSQRRKRHRWVDVFDDAIHLICRWVFSLCITFSHLRVLYKIFVRFTETIRQDCQAVS